MMMRTLDSYGEEEKLSQSGIVSESVRNQQFYDIAEELPDRQQMIFEIILEHSPKGISSMGIHRLTKKPLHTFSGRLSELANPKGKEKVPYCNPPLIEACGVEIYPDHDGRMRRYTKYRVIGTGEN